MGYSAIILPSHHTSFADRRLRGTGEFSSFLCHAQICAHGEGIVEKEPDKTIRLLEQQVFWQVAYLSGSGEFPGLM